MILFFSDIHLGVRHHSIIHDDNLYTAEKDTLIALDEVKKRASADDITMVICGGDVFHSYSPSVLNIKKLIIWLQEFDKLGKPFYIIPGNHDCSLTTHALIFIERFNFKNIKVIDKYSEEFNIDFNSRTIHFVPYTSHTSLKDKDKITYSNIEEVVSKAKNGDIIISHVQEKSSVMGSEAVMISKGVDILNLDSDKELLFLLGHIHRHQVYKRKNNTICYSGATSYMNAGDLNSPKGYCLIDDNLNISFEIIKGIRLFKEYNIKQIKDYKTYFKELRMPVNHVGFIRHNYDSIDIKFIENVFKKNKSTIGWIRKESEAIRKEGILENLNLHSKSSKEIYEEAARQYVEKYDFKYSIDELLTEGFKLLDELK